MGNHHKGDTQFQAGGKTFTLCYNNLALARLEIRLDKGLPQILAELQDPAKGFRIGTVIALFWAGLQRHHPNITYEEAAELMDEMDNGTVGARQVIDECFERSFAAAGTKATNPTTNGAAGTGTTYSSNIAVTDMIRPDSGT